MGEERDEVAGSHYASAERHVNAGYAFRDIMHVVFRWIGIIIGLALLFYLLVLAPTSVRFLYTDSDGVVLTTDPKIQQGRIPEGTPVLARIGVGENRLDNYWGKLLLAVTPQSDVSDVAIIAGPDGRITEKDGVLVYNGEKTKIPTSAKPANLQDKGYLDGDYWVICMSDHSACEYGKTYLISPGDIIGQVKNTEDEDTTSEVMSLVFNDDHTSTATATNGTDITTKDSTASTGSTGSTSTQ